MSGTPNDDVDDIPEVARAPGYLVQYGVGIPAGLWVGAVVALPILLGASTVAPTLGVVGAVVAFVGAGGLTTRAVVRRIRSFQEQRLLSASEAVPGTTRQLKAAGGTEAPVAVRD